MAILNKDTYNATIKALIGDRTDDEALTALEDLTDTFNSYADTEDWKSKYEENDKAWREKYKSRFLDGPSEDETKEDESKDDESDEENITIDDLFEDKE